MPQTARIDRSRILLEEAAYRIAVIASIVKCKRSGIPLPTGDATFQLEGDQVVRGVTQPTVYDTTAQLTPDTMVGTARAALKMTSFGITPPDNALYEVSDDMIAEVRIKASVAGPAGSAAAPSASDSTASAGEAP